MSARKAHRPRIAVRPAIRDDLGAIEAIERAAFKTGDRFARANLRRLIASPSAAVLIAADPGRSGAPETVGYVAVLTRRGASAARLYSIAVAPMALGRGVGAALLAAAAATAAARGADRLRLEVRSSNRAARRLYERAGFRQFDEYPGYYSDGETAIRYEMRVGGKAGGRSAQA